MIQAGRTQECRHRTAYAQKRGCAFRHRPWFFFSAAAALPGDCRSFARGPVIRLLQSVGRGRALLCGVLVSQALGVSRCWSRPSSPHPPSTSLHRAVGVRTILPLGLPRLSHLPLNPAFWRTSGEAKWNDGLGPRRADLTSDRSAEQSCHHHPASRRWRSARHTYTHFFHSDSGRFVYAVGLDSGTRCFLFLAPAVRTCNLGLLLTYCAPHPLPLLPSPTRSSCHDPQTTSHLNYTRAPFLGCMLFHLPP